MPYRDLPPQSFWKTCQDDSGFRQENLYLPKITLRSDMKVATAGSCFAQNLAPYLRRSSLAFVDVETPPRLMAAKVAARFGFGQFSARTGNIYTARQLRQLIDDVVEHRVRDCAVWEHQGRFFDALRLQVEPSGFETEDELRLHRYDHLGRVRQMIAAADVLVFTLGLTEAWTDTQSGTVFSSAPGVVAGTYVAGQHEFVNFGFEQVREDLLQALAAMRSINPAIRLILTVSPVPLSATATGSHVLAATTYSKAVLRAVAGELSTTQAGFDYFPSYEMITSHVLTEPQFAPDGRHVRPEAVARVMQAFFAAHPEVALDAMAPEPGEDLAAVADLACEEAMLDAFAGGTG